MSIYRSPAGRRALEACYDDAREQLEDDVERAGDGSDRRGIDLTDARIETRHGSTHVLLAGPPDGPPILAFHGGNATNPMTLAWYAELADEYRLLAPDTLGQPGYSAETRLDPRGDGYGEWVADLLDAFDLDSAPTIGTSYGGGIVLRAAAHVPDRIDRAALVVPAGFGTGPIASTLRVALPALGYRYLPRSMRGPSERLLDRVLEAIATEADPDPIVRRTVGASLRHLDLEREFPGADATELDGFDAPVALFVGERDPFFPPEVVLPRAKERLSTVDRIEVLTGERHLLSSRAQRRVTESIREFFEAE